MREKQLRPNEIIWNNNKAENHRLNEALLVGRWRGSEWRHGIMARIILKRILQPKLNGTVQK